MGGPLAVCWSGADGDERREERVEVLWLNLDAFVMHVGL
jgi:hypothetical protein